MSRKSKTTKSESKKTTTKKGGKKNQAGQVAVPVAAADATEAPAAEKRARKAKPTKAKRVSALDAAAQVLQAEGAAMPCKALIEAMTAQGLWSSPGGKTPQATLYSAILREITAKGSQARFRKVDRGQFEFNAGARA